MAKSFTTLIDLTTRGQEQARLEEAASQSIEPEDALPEADPAQWPAPMQTALAAAGWSALMPVQQKAIPYMLAGRDLIVQSRTGSGKTGAFLLPLFTLLDPTRKEVQALVLTPTRELALQVFDEFERMRQGAPAEARLQSVSVYGGVRYQGQLQGLRGGAQVVIGTPGRILDHLERGSMTLKGLRVLIFDEADEMLSMGFYPAMRKLKRFFPDGPRQSYMYSATMPPKVRSLAREFLHEPGFLSLSVGQVSVDAIEHRYYVVPKMEKDRALARLIEMENPDSAIVFVNTKREVEYLAQFLKNYGYDADAISGDLSQKAREEVMARIRRGTLRFLIATDVAARGIDISDLSHVFMYDVPQDPEYYVHRAGRTARAGKTGVALVLATFEDERSLLSIARRYDIDIMKHPVPAAEDVEARVAERMTVVLEQQAREATNMERERLRRFIPLVRDLAQEEPELLALLVDRLYHETLHERPDQPSVEPAEPEAAAEEEPSTEEPSTEEASPSSEAPREGGGRSGRRRKKRRGGGQS